MLNVPQWCDVTKHTTHSYTVSKVTVVLITVYRRMVAVVWMFNETEKQYYCQIWLKTSKGYPQGSACCTAHRSISTSKGKRSLYKSQPWHFSINYSVCSLNEPWPLVTGSTRMTLQLCAQVGHSSSRALPTAEGFSDLVRSSSCYILR